MTQLQYRLESIRIAGGFSEAVIERFRGFLEKAPDEVLFRMNPYQVAAKLEIDARAATDLLLHATHAGVLEFSWGVVCPACKAFLVTKGALKSLTSGRRCNLCEIALESSVDDSVEVAFTVAPTTRRIRFHDATVQEFWRDGLRLLRSSSATIPERLAAHLAHPIWSETVIPGRTSARTLELNGRYLGGIPVQHAFFHLETDPASTVTQLEFDASEGHISPDRVRVAPGKVLIKINSRLREPALFGLLTDFVPPVAERTPERMVGLHSTMSASSPAKNCAHRRRSENCFARRAFRAKPVCSSRVSPCSSPT